MARKAKLKSTGEFIEVRSYMDIDGNTTWLEDATNTEYYPHELEFIPEAIGKIRPISGKEAYMPEDIVSFSPMEMHYDASSMTARFIQNMQIRITEEVIQAALAHASEAQLRDELQRRVKGQNMPYHE